MEINMTEEYCPGLTWILFVTFSFTFIFMIYDMLYLTYIVKTLKKSLQCIEINEILFVLLHTMYFWVLSTAKISTSCLIKIHHLSLLWIKHHPSVIVVYNFQLSTFLHCNVSTKERDFKYYFHNFKRLGLLFNLSGGISQTYGETLINRNFLNLKYVE